MIQELVPLKRVTKDIIISGKKGIGKSIILAFIGKIHNYYNNSIVFCDFTPNYEHIRINTVNDLSKIIDMNKNIPKIVLIDDAERLIFSRYSNKDENIEFLNNCLLDWGKCNTNAYFTIKREMAIDIGVREESNEFWEIEQHLKIRSKTGNIDLDKKNDNKLKKYLNFLKLRVIRLDEYFEKMPDIWFKDLISMSKHYDTQEIIKSGYKIINKEKINNLSYKIFNP